MKADWEYPLTNYVLRRVSIPIARHLANTPVTPAKLTILAMVVGISGSVVILLGYLVTGIVVLAISLLLDVVDGDLARLTEKASRSGAFLDSVFDRIVDSAFILALIWIDFPRHSTWGYLLLTGSLLVSYVRARAEAVDVDCKVGLASRDIRLLFLMIAGLLYAVLAEAVLYSFILLTIANFATVLQRVVYTYRRTTQ